MNNYHKYLPVTELEKKWDFYITTAGYSKTDAHQAYPLSKEHPLTHAFTWNKGRILNDYYLVFISRGQGVFDSEQTGEVEITAGTCFFLFPEVWHRYKPNQSSGWEEYWVGFNGNYPAQLMNGNFFDRAKPFIAIGPNEELLILLHQLLEKVRTAAIGYHQVISGIVLQILGLIYVIARHKEQPVALNEQLISKAKFLLRESLEPVNIQKLSRDLSMGYSKFRKEFTKATGQSPNQYHLALRVEKAKDLLRSTTLTINEIAYQTGFESIFYFSKFFKKKTGESPKAYRLKNR